MIYYIWNRKVAHCIKKRLISPSTFKSINLRNYHLCVSNKHLPFWTTPNENRRLYEKVAALTQRQYDKLSIKSEHILHVRKVKYIHLLLQINSISISIQSQLPLKRNRDLEKEKLKLNNSTVQYYSYILSRYTYICTCM